MAQQTLQTIVSIGGRVDNSFGVVGEQLIGLGSQIDLISQKIIDLGKESVEEYVNYDDLMRQVKAVGEFTDAEISSLDAINSQIAKTTIYTNTQAAEAEVLMGQYGMMIPEIKTMLPEALDLAMAGNIEVANSIDYLYSSIKSLGEDIDYVTILTDQMAKTAAIGATDVDTLGDSLTRLGSGAQMFKGGSVEILAILSEMSQFGEDQRGSVAGTWIRNFMLSLSAPMGELDDIVDAMEQMGATQEEIDEYVTGKSSGVAAEAIDTLTDAGLRIYDESGNLLPAIEIIRSLRDAVKGSGDYADDLTELSSAYDTAAGDVDAFLESTDGLTDNALYNIFRRIFGRRGVTTALNLISISDAEWEDTINEIVNSDGFAESMAETMQGGLGGSLRELEATFTEFETTIGGILAPSVEGVSDFLKDIVLSLDDMDEDTLDALLTGLGVIGIAGPGLITTGLALRFIGYALTPVGAVGLGLVGLASLTAIISKLEDARFTSNFGTMALDMETLSPYITGLGADFLASYTEINEFSDALDGAVTAYEEASTAFSSQLLTNMLTGAELTDEEKASLYSLGEELGKQLNEGIVYSTAASMSYWTMLFGGDDAAVDDPDYLSIIGILNTGYEDLLSTAESLSQQLRGALNSAFEDNTLTQEEYGNIMGVLDAYNAALAEATDKENYVELQTLLHKAQTASFDDMQTFAEEVDAARESTLAEEQERFEREFYGLEWDFNKAIEDAETEIEKEDWEDKKISALASAQKYHDEREEAIKAQYDDVLIKMWSSGLEQSDLATVLQSAEDITAQVMQGLLSPETAEALLREQYGINYLAGETGLGSASTDRSQLGQALVRYIYSLGGYEALAEKIAYYEGIGDTETTEQLRMLQTMEQIVNGFMRSGLMDSDGGWMSIFNGKIIQGWESSLFDGMALPVASEVSGINTSTAHEMIDTAEQNGNFDALWGSIGTLGSENGATLTDLAASLQNLTDGQEDVFNSVVEGLAKTYDFAAVLESMGGAEQYGDLGDVVAAHSLLYGSASQNAGDYLLNQEPLSLPVDTDTSGVSVFLDEAQDLLTANPGTWNVKIRLDGWFDYPELPGGDDDELDGYADGGRATQLSFFGEDGAEWAIPEEHSDRTAELLLSAASASGFTWPELLSRTGGLNANPNHTPHQLIYSPTIIVKDAQGVAEVLAQDKERLERWFAEKQLHDEIEVYT